MSKILKPLKAGRLFTFNGHIYQIRKNKQGWGTCRRCIFWSACGPVTQLPVKIMNVCKYDFDCYIKLIK